MNYSKAMIDLVREARRRAPSEDKPSIKLANPELFNDLALIYSVSDDSVIKAIVKELFYLAGEPWRSMIHPSDDGVLSEQKNKFVAKVYRGKTSLEVLEKTSKANEDTEDSISKPKRIYRGRVVA